MRSAFGTFQGKHFWVFLQKSSKNCLFQEEIWFGRAGGAEFGALGALPLGLVRVRLAAGGRGAGAARHPAGRPQHRQAGRGQHVQNQFGQNLRLLSGRFRKVPRLHQQKRLHRNW